MRWPNSLCAICAALCLAAAVPAAAVPTDITVRVLSRDGKFIGSSMNGAAVVIADAETGEVLASGVTSGGTGDTARLMRQARERHARLAGADTAAFRTRIDIDAPRRLRVAATGPLEPAHAAQTVTAEQWVMPGKHLTGGDGWVLEIPGFAVTVTAPAEGASVATGEGTVALRAEVSMMCGCPLTPGGLWDSERFEIAAVVTRDGQRRAPQPLRYAGKASQFEADIPVQPQADYQVLVYAYDPATGNTGLHRVRFTVP